MPTNEEVLDKEFILGKLIEILEDPEVSAKDKLKAIELSGEYRKMFKEQRLQIDLRSIIAGLNARDLKELKSHGPTIEGLTYNVIPELPSSGS
jgi:hypothetical protein